jgi:predicted kinase
METREKSSTMRALVTAVGGLMLPGENRKSWLARIADETGLAPRVVRAAYYEETTSRNAAAKLKAAADNEANQIARQFDEMAAKLEIHDPDFYGPQADAMRHVARTLRGTYRGDRDTDGD